MDEIGGFPVVGEEFEDGENVEGWSLESITERDLDPDAFEPPSGYRLKNFGRILPVKVSFVGVQNFEPLRLIPLGI